MEFLILDIVRKKIFFYGSRNRLQPLEGSEKFRVLWWWRDWGLKGLKIGKEKPPEGGGK